MRINLRKIGKLAAALLILPLTSCYSDFVNLDYEAHHGAVHNVDNSNDVAFIASTSAYRSPEGFSRFPDGGTPKYLFQKIFLYILDTENHKIARVLDLNDLADLIGTSKSKWKIKLIFNESFIYYHVSPVTAWSLHKKWKEKSFSPEKMNEIINRYEKFYKINVSTGEITEVGSSTFQKIFAKYYEKTKISLTTLNNELKSTKLSELDLLIKNFDSKDDDQFIDETIYLKNGSQITRRAVIEQIIASKSKKEISALLEKMDQYKNSLTGSKKTQYDIFSKGTYSAIRSLVDDNCEMLAKNAAEQWKKENYIKADKLYRKAIDCDPKNPRVWNDFGEMNYEAGSINAADSAFSEALRLDSSFAPAWKNFGIMAIDNEDYPHALEYLEKASQLDPSDKSITTMIDKLKNQLGVVTENDP